MQTDQSKATLRLAIDGGNLIPDSPVQNGIQRLVSGFLQGTSELNYESNIDYYYFGATSRGDSHRFKYHRLPSLGFGSFFLPLSVITSRASHFLGFSGHIPVILSGQSVQKILFFHDFGFLKYPGNYVGSQRKLAHMAKQSLYAADKVIVFSDYIKNEVVARYPTLSEKIYRIYPGVDHLPAKTGICIVSDYLLFVGVLKPMKDIERLFSIFSEYRNDHPQTRLIIVGTGEPTYLKALMRSPLYQSIALSVDFLTHLSDEQLVFCYQHAKAVINVSHDEGFCYPVVEALSLGVPVVANNLHLYTELAQYFPHLKQGKTDKDILALLEKIKDKRKEYQCPRKFRWKTFAEEVLKLISER